MRFEHIMSRNINLECSSYIFYRGSIILCSDGLFLCTSPRLDPLHRAKSSRLCRSVSQRLVARWVRTGILASMTAAMSTMIK